MKTVFKFIISIIAAAVILGIIVATGISWVAGMIF
jgi:hypothetical protein